MWELVCGLIAVYPKDTVLLLTATATNRYLGPAYIHSVGSMGTLILVLQMVQCYRRVVGFADALCDEWMDSYI